MTKHSVRFSDIAGCDEACGEMEQVLEFIKHPQRFQRLGARVPRGVLLSGPPGTGKVRTPLGKGTQLNPTQLQYSSQRNPTQLTIVCPKPHPPPPLRGTSEDHAGARHRG